MGVLGALVVLAVGVYLVACLLAGFGPAGDLSGFEPDNAPMRRSFRQPTDTVVAAYRAAVSMTPGMRLAAEGRHELLVDLRPTSRVIGGNFGLVIRLRFRSEGASTCVEADARNKAPFAFSNHGAAFEHAERALRTRAKRHASLDEILKGLGHPKPSG